MMTEQILDRNSHALPEDADGYAIPAADILSDFLVEHDDDPDEGDPADWPREYDSIRVALGPAYFREETFAPLPDDDPDPGF